MVARNNHGRWGSHVVPRWQFDPRRDEFGLFLWVTVVWFAVLAVAALVLVWLGGLVAF